MGAALLWQSSYDSSHFMILKILQSLALVGMRCSC